MKVELGFVIKHVKMLINEKEPTFVRIWWRNKRSSMAQDRDADNYYREHQRLLYDYNRFRHEYDNYNEFRDSILKDEQFQRYLHCLVDEIKLHPYGDFLMLDIRLQSL